MKKGILRPLGSHVRGHRTTKKQEALIRHFLNNTLLSAKRIAERVSTSANPVTESMIIYRWETLPSHSHDARSEKARGGKKTKITPEQRRFIKRALGITNVSLRKIADRAEKYGPAISPVIVHREKVRAGIRRPLKIRVRGTKTTPQQETAIRGMLLNNVPLREIAKRVSTPENPVTLKMIYYRLERIHTLKKR
jgi:hypothetical protein